MFSSLPVSSKKQKPLNGPSDTATNGSDVSLMSAQNLILFIFSFLFCFDAAKLWGADEHYVRVMEYFSLIAEIRSKILFLMVSGLNTMRSSPKDVSSRSSS